MAAAGENHFTTKVVWTGNQGEGTARYDGYSRNWNIAADGKPVIPCSNDPTLGGDASLMNPEDLLLSALASCHMLWYLHLAANAGITVIEYEDAPLGIGETSPNGAGKFTKAILRPRITVKAGADIAKAAVLHNDVHTYCYIARSMNFPIEITPKFSVKP